MRLVAAGQTKRYRRDREMESAEKTIATVAAITGPLPPRPVRSGSARSAPVRTETGLAVWVGKAWSTAPQGTEGSVDAVGSTDACTGSCMTVALATAARWPSSSCLDCPHDTQNCASRSNCAPQFVQNSPVAMVMPRSRVGVEPKPQAPWTHAFFRQADTSPERPCQ